MKSTAVATVLVVAGLFAFVHFQKRPTADGVLSSKLIESSEPDRLPFSTHCPDLTVGELRFKSTATTSLALARHLGADRDPAILADAQLKYVRGFFHFSEFQGLKINALVNSSITVTSAKESKYPNRIELDLPADDDYTRYPSNFFPRTIKKGEPAFTVEYEARLPIATCVRGQWPETNPELLVPVDPLLAFWYVPKESRREVRFGRIKSVTNPCAYEQMADLKRPVYYSYVWNPIKSGEDFDCKTLIGRDETHAVSVNFERASGSSQLHSVAEHLPEGPIRVAMVFGHLGPKDDGATARGIRANLAGFGAETQFEGIDSGAQIGSLVLNVVSRLAEIEPLKATESDGSFVFKTRGKLKESGRAVEIEAFVGPTVEYQTGQKHWDFLADALSRAHFVFYNGHAGMGSTLKLADLENRTKKSLKNEETPKYQFIAALSCFATDYFGPDFVAARAKSGYTTDVMLAGFEGHSFMMIPAVLQYVDLSLAGKRASLKKSMERFLSIDEPVHMRRYVGPST